jgi:class 3 adenylate cyclase/tetratricopeptide (TPR) repeat protein
MKCEKCGGEIPVNQPSCPICKAPAQTQKFCPTCGAKRGTGENFCPECGHKYPEAASQKEKVPPKSIETPPPPASESQNLKHVTILCVDLKSSTEMVWNKDPEEARELLSPTMERLTNLVYEYGGIVISKAGDGLTAIFGAPKAVDNHALRACLASLAMKKESQLVLRIGLNSGQVLIEYDGSKYDAVGAPVYLAARMQQTAKPGTIQLSEETVKLIASFAIVEKSGKVEAKGFPEPIEAYELKSVKESKSFNELINQFKSSVEFVNRTEELGKAAALLKKAIGGQGNGLGISGDPGTGKSRLTYEIVKTEEAKNCNILFTTAFIHTKHIPLSSVRMIFSDLFDLLPDAKIEEVRKIIAPFLAKVQIPHAMNASLVLVNFIPNDPEWTALEPGLKKKYVIDVGLKILFNSIQEKPLIIICEDLHWIDAESEVFLDAVLSQIADKRALLLVNYRPEYHDTWSNRANYTQVALKPLSSENCLQILHYMLGKDPSLDELKDKLVKTVEGNPFFLQELVFSLISDKILIGLKGYRLKEGTIVKELHLSEAIALVYQAKIDKLDSFERTILQIASVIGMKFLYSQIIQLLDFTDEREVRIALSDLVDRKLIYEDRLYPEMGYAFTNALTCEMTYNGMLKKTKKALHLKFFQFLEKTLTEDQVDQMQIIAGHAYNGENWERALYYYAKAASNIVEISTFSTIVELYERALLAADHLPQEESLSKTVMQIHYELYYIYVPLGKFEKQFEHIEKALKIALSLKDKLFESLLYSAFCVHCMGYKSITEALEYSQKALQVAKEIQSAYATGVALFSLANVQIFMGQLKKVSETNRELEKTINDLDYRTQYAKLPICHLSRCYECWARSFIGDFAYVEELCKGWFATSKNLKEPNIPNIARYGALGMNYYYKGDFEKSIENLNIALQYSLTIEAVIFTPICYSMLADMYLRMNKLEEGKKNLALALEIMKQLRGAFLSVAAVSPIIECLMLTGAYSQAKDFCETGTMLLKERKLFVLYDIALKLSADIDLCLPNPDFTAIKAKLDEAMDLFNEFGIQPQLARLHLTLATMYQKMGDTENFKLEKQKASSDFERLGMPYWARDAKTF